MHFLSFELSRVCKEFGIDKLLRYTYTALYNHEIEVFWCRLWWVSTKYCCKGDLVAGLARLFCRPFWKTLPNRLLQNLSYTYGGIFPPIEGRGKKVLSCCFCILRYSARRSILHFYRCGMSFAGYFIKRRFKIELHYKYKKFIKRIQKI